MLPLCFYQDLSLSFSHKYDLYPKQEEFFLHIHEQYEIYCFLSGDAEYLVEGSVYPLKPGYILLMRPTEVHKVRFISHKPYERCVIQFSEHLLDYVDPEKYLLQSFLYRPLGKKNCFLPSEFKGILPNDILETICSSAGNDKERRIKVLSYLYPLLDQLNIAFLQKDDLLFTNHTSAENLVLYINNHLNDNLSRQSLSDHFFLSTSQINRIFKQFTGSSVGEYILVKRLMNAKSLLHQGKSAAEACESSGFKDYSAFYRSYLKRFGISPKQDMTLQETDF